LRVVAACGRLFGRRTRDLARDGTCRPNRGRGGWEKTG